MQMVQCIKSIVLARYGADAKAEWCGCMRGIAKTGRCEMDQAQQRREPCQSEGYDEGGGGFDEGASGGGGGGFSSASAALSSASSRSLARTTFDWR